ncbi:MULTISPECIES: divergent PAP2 family protein [Treponema]|uniref:Acid phosphatase/vanadium-dependent haloperoxidase related protein n=1 Tax=Treponema saccharophilum DSM 2985 TaxID=907348 RepID=H7EME7_9SPIR|nr:MULTISPECIES: divergent PAP2 family protein [Treponema]EIC01232.1 acid phosphatase/vanadium-dependent haloperoxidase related protein [Treponema saccharophilum DSM 2985]MBQ5536350.1 divergent PAP2 family protein [Treponema sp.]BDC95986.1 phosphatidic acid phosphatase [Treponema saccharophilum]
MFSTVSGQIHTLLVSPTFLACAFSWVCAQFLKTIIKLFSGKVHSLIELFDLMFWRTGGMPSSHSAVVSCVATCVGLRSGLDSDVFIVSFVLFFITIRDALGVRRANGIHARRINEIISVLNFFEKKSVEKELPKEEELPEDVQQVKEVNGHSPLEVFVGVLLGIFVGMAFSVLK